jgi:hypothetical protein
MPWGAPTNPWLCGAWERRYIKQGEPLTEQEADPGTVVRYIQAPHGFVDVRVGADRPAWPDGSTVTLDSTVTALEAQGFGKPGWAGMMAFAGVTVVREASYEGVEVHYQAILGGREAISTRPCIFCIEDP